MLWEILISGRFDRLWKEASYPFKIQPEQCAHFNFDQWKGLTLEVRIRCTDNCRGMTSVIMLQCNKPGLHLLDGECQVCGRPLLAEIDFVR